MVEWLFDRLRGEWTVIRQAPLSVALAVFVLVILTSIAIWKANAWYYGGTIEQKNARIDALLAGSTSTGQCRDEAGYAIDLAGQIHGLVERATRDSQRLGHLAVATIWGEFVPHRYALEFERTMRIAAKTRQHGIRRCIRPDKWGGANYDAELTFGVMKAIAQDLERLAREVR